MIRRPTATIRPIFVCWWIGIVFYRVIPLAFLAWGGSPVSEGTPLAAVIRILSWAGAFLLFRAAVELILWERPASRWFRIALGLFVLGQTLGALELAPIPVVTVLCLPLIPAYRWRSGLNAAGLLQAIPAFLLTAILAVIEPQTTPGGAVSEAAGRAAGMMTPVVFLYSLLGVFVLARRLHLSIRRIRSRLVLSHLLISVLPVVLTGLFLLLSGTLFLSTYRGQITARRLQAVAREATDRIADSIDATGVAPLDPFGSTVPGQTVLMDDGSGARILAGTPPSIPWTRIFEQDLTTADAPLLWDGNSLFIRSRWDGTDASGNSVTVEALCLLDSLRMAELSGFLGTPAWVDPGLYVEQTSTGITITGAGDARQGTRRGEVSTRTQPDHRMHDGGQGGTPPVEPADAPSPGSARTRQTQSPSGQVDTSTLGRGRLPGGAVIPALSWDEENASWSRITMPVISSAGFGEQISSLFKTAEENPLATAVLLILGLLAVLLAATVWITTSMVSEMIRSITKSVRALTTATHAIGQGDLSHRVVLEARDELWDVAESFNGMSEDLGRMQAIEMERSRLEEDLRLAREIQDRLLPSGAPDLPNIDLAGVSVSAREVGGDYYDFIALPDDKVGLVVADVSGKGTPAAMLMSAFRAALRSQDLTVSGPAEILGRVNGFIHASVDPGRFITAFVAVLDPRSGRMRYANAGHDAPLLLGPDGTMRELAGGGLILGMLPRIVYEDAGAVIDKGNTLLVYTDGVTEARDATGGFFGIDRLRSGFEEARDGSASEILEKLMNDLKGFRGDAPQSDDITMLLARRT